MKYDHLRQLFERTNPLPAGVHYDGHHYNGCRHVAGSFSNAAIWNHLWTGWKQCAEATKHAN